MKTFYDCSIKGFFLLAFIAIISLEPAHAVSPEKVFAENDDLKLTANRLAFIENKKECEGKCLFISYKVYNKSNSDIWINVENGYGAWKNPFKYMTIVLENYWTVHLKFVNVVYPIGYSTYLGSFAKYVRIPTGESKEFSLILNSPVEEFIPFEDFVRRDQAELANEEYKCPQKSLDADEIGTVILEVGYYKKDLFDPAVKDCCTTGESVRNKNEEDTLYVSQSWSRANRERLISISINRVDSIFDLNLENANRHLQEREKSLREKYREKSTDKKEKD